MGLGFIATYRRVHFSDVIKQFLSTLEVKYDNSKKKTHSEGNLHFKIENDAYKLSITQVCEAYDFSDRSLVKFSQM